MDSDGASQEQPEGAPEEKGASEKRSTDWTKEKIKSFSKQAYTHAENWLSGPWWFQEKEPVAKFTGWVAAFTGILVIVSALQFCTLQSTDRTTHDALVASSRAWVGPLTTTISAVQKDKPIDGSIQYQNTGREPAANFLPDITTRTYSLEEWNSGSAAQDIIKAAKACFSISNLPDGLQVVYPNTGFSSYQLHFNTDEALPKVIVTDEMIAGKTIFKIQGCFIYRSIHDFHHSSFCYYYRANLTNLPNLSICTVGNDAD